MTIQEAIELAIKKKSNVRMSCHLTNEEIRKEITDAKGCGVYWDDIDTGANIEIDRLSKGTRIRIVPPEFDGDFGGTGPVITISSLDKIH